MEMERKCEKERKRKQNHTVRFIFEAVLTMKIKVNIFKKKLAPIS
jgi:hypothetical protein